MFLNESFDSFVKKLGRHCTEMESFLRIHPGMFQKKADSVVDTRVWDSVPHSGLANETRKVLGNISYGFPIKETPKNTKNNNLGNIVEIDSRDW